MAKSEVRPRIRGPRTARKGEVMEIKTLITHPMESGQRRGENGRRIPRMIVNRFVVRYNGEEVLRSHWHPALASNPFLSFFVVAERSGEIEFEWVDDAGRTYATSARVTVTG